jgi:hypothetical protein
LKPYFNVDGKETIKRLFSTLKPTEMKEIIHHPDLYGPLMLGKLLFNSKFQLS